jgi:hypothetical protein
MKTQIAKKLFALALAAAAVAVPSVASAAPLPGIFHLHPRTTDTRIRYTVFNRADLFYEVRIAGKVYEILPHHVLTITAPAGTQVYAAMDMHTHKNGSLLHELTPEDNSKMLILY